MSIHVKDFGVFPDEAKVQTKELQAAIDRCAEMGGGEILFDAGVYRTGTLWLRSNTYLHLPYGCRIKGSDDFEDYNEPDAYPQNTPIPPERANGKHLIVAVEVENCGIFGGGIIDGNGLHFGYRHEDGFTRPSQMLHFVESKNVRLLDIELTNAPYWSCHLHGCENVLLRGLKVNSNPSIRNCDGIDIDASRNVIVSDCLIDTQDDCITLRCNTSLLGSLKNTDRALENVTITNCHIHTKRCNAFRVGVGNGPIRNCRISNVTVSDSAKGVCMEARYVFNDEEKPGTPIENISFDNCYFDCLLPIFLTSNCLGISDDAAPRIRNINFSNMTIRAEHNIVVQSNPNALVENITFNNIDFDCVGEPKLRDEYLECHEWTYATSPAAFYTTHAKGVTLRDFRVNVVDATSPITKGIISYGSEIKTENVSFRRLGAPMELIEER